MTLYEQLMPIEIEKKREMTAKELIAYAEKLEASNIQLNNENMGLVVEIVEKDLEITALKEKNAEYYLMIPKH